MAKRFALLLALTVLTSPAHAEGRPKGCPNAWCGCWLAKHLGISDSSLNWARAWLRFPRTTPHVGAVAVLRRRGGGHVGIVRAFDANGNPVLLSGNHRHRVGIGKYPKSRVIAYVNP